LRVQAAFDSRFRRFRRSTSNRIETGEIDTAWDLWTSAMEAPLSESASKAAGSVGFSPAGVGSFYTRFGG
jgi:hypothetical protein